MDTREAPPSAPPPYVRAVTRVYRRPLRPIVLFTTVISLLWALAAAVARIRDMGDDGETSKMRMFDLILAILYFVIAGIEGFGLAAAMTQRAPLARFYFILSGVAAVVVLVAEIIRLAAHFVLKSDLLSGCQTDLTGDTAETTSGQTTVISASDAASLCNTDWRNGIFWDLGWLLVATVLSVMFATLAAAYYHQLLDPAFTRTQAPSNAFRMGNYANAPYQQDPPFVPPAYGPDPMSGESSAGYGVTYAGMPDQPPEYKGGDYNNNKAEKEKDLGRTMTAASDSTVTLHPVSLRDEGSSEAHRLAPGEGRI